VCECVCVCVCVCVFVCVGHRGAVNDEREFNSRIGRIFYLSINELYTHIYIHCTVNPFLHPSIFPSIHPSIHPSLPPSLPLSLPANTELLYALRTVEKLTKSITG